MSVLLPFKKASVNYSNNPFCKTLALPMITVLPDIMLCGHTHQYERINANKSGYAISTDPRHSATTETLINP